MFIHEFACFLMVFREVDGQVENSFKLFFIENIEV